MSQDTISHGFPDIKKIRRETANWWKIEIGIEIEEAAKLGKFHIVMDLATLFGCKDYKSLTEKYPWFHQLHEGLQSSGYTVIHDKNLLYIKW